MKIEEVAAEAARVIGVHPSLVDSPEFVLFARLVIDKAVSDEREECAKVCDDQVTDNPDDHAANYFDGGCRTCAGEIRMRSNAELKGGA